MTLCRQGLQQLVIGINALYSIYLANNFLQKHFLHKRFLHSRCLNQTPVRDI